MKRRPLARQIDLGGERGEAEAEPAVDRIFGGPKASDRLALLMAGVEQGPHHRSKERPSPVSRQDAGDSDAGRAHPSAGNGQAETEKRPSPDSAVAIPCGVYAVGGHNAGDSVDLVVIGSRTPEIIPDRGNRLPDLLRRGAGSNFSVHGGVRPRKLLPEARPFRSTRAFGDPLSRAASDLRAIISRTTLGDHLPLPASSGAKPDLLAMSATKILWGQMLLVGAVVLAFLWAATEWTAWELGFQAQLGPPWFRRAVAYDQCDRVEFARDSPAGGRRISTCMGFFLSSGRFFGFCRFFVRSWKAVLRPVACDQVRGARGRGRGTETVAKLAALPPSVACVSQHLDA